MELEHREEAKMELEHWEEVETEEEKAKEILAIFWSYMQQSHRA